MPFKEKKRKIALSKSTFVGCVFKNYGRKGLGPEHLVH